MTGRLVSLGLTLILASTASAFGGRGWWRAPVATAHYYVIPYCPPAVHAIPVTPVPAAPPRSIYAVPTPAPPSQTIEPPPITPKMPPVKELNAPIIGTQTSASLAPDRCRVGFWNLSGRDVTLTIDGKSWTLQRNRAVTVDLGREFSWQVDQQSRRVERVPAALNAHEVVIRN